MASSKIEEFRISKLIIKSVLETLSTEEAFEFEQWLSLSSNKKFYEKILKEDNFEDKIDLFKGLDKEVAYLKLIERIEMKKQNGKRKLSSIFKNVYKYSAVALLLLSVGYFWIYKTSPTQTSENDHNRIINLEPGYNKATLVLEDGTEIDLERNEFVKKQTLAQLKNKNNALVYEPYGKDESSSASQVVKTNTLFVPIGGIYKVVLPDGSTVWLNSASYLKYPTAFKGDQRIVELSGEAYFEVVKDGRKTFIVKTKTRDIMVLGTSFNVSTYSDDAQFTVTLANGSIQLKHDDTKEVFLKPGEQAIVDYNSLSTTEVIKVEPDIYSTWKNGTFFFENENLDYILRKVGRWYNFKIEFSDPELSKITFTGLASKEFPAKRLLDRISKSSNIKYEINQNLENAESIVKISKK